MNDNEATLTLHVTGPGVGLLETSEMARRCLAKRIKWDVWSVLSMALGVRMQDTAGMYDASLAQSDGLTSLLADLVGDWPVGVESNALEAARAILGVDHDE